METNYFAFGILTVVPVRDDPHCYIVDSGSKGTTGLSSLLKSPVLFNYEVRGINRLLKFPGAIEELFSMIGEAYGDGQVSETRKIKYYTQPMHVHIHESTKLLDSSDETEFIDDDFIVDQTCESVLEVTITLPRQAKDLPVWQSPEFPTKLLEFRRQIFFGDFCTSISKDITIKLISSLLGNTTEEESPRRRVWTGYNPNKAMTYLQGYDVEF